MKYKYLTILIVWLFINLPTLAFASSITGTVYQDENNNNVYDSATDIGLGNVTVSLYQNNGTPSDLSDDIFLQNTITDIATGLYQFTDIDSPLSYRIEVSETDEDLPLGVTIGTSNPLTHVTVAAESTTANQDFGFDQQAPFNCDKHFYVGHAAAADLNSQLSRIDGQQSPFALASVVANQTAHYNAMGYREQDHYIYAVKSASNHILRLGSDGSVVDLGAALGLPTPSHPDNGYEAGAVFMDGHFYIHRAGANDVVYQLDVTQSPPQVLATHSLTYATPPHQAANVSLGDFVYNRRDNNVYGVSDQGNVLMINPITWRVSVIGDAVDPAVYSAAYSDNEGKIYVYQQDQDQGQLYQVDVGLNGSGSGRLSALSPLPNLAAYDGASCPSNTPEFAQPDLRLEKRVAANQAVPVNPSESITFTLTVTNEGTAVANAIYLTDYIPNTLTLNDSAWELSGDNQRAVLKQPITQLAPNESESVNITFTANSELRIGGIIITDEAECRNAAEISDFIGSADRDSVPDQIDGNDFAEDDYDVATVTINGLCEAQYDFGDAPDQAQGSSQGNYQTLATDNGARHAISELLYLGACVDTDDGDLQSVDARADDTTASNYMTFGTCATEHDDEDGLQIPSFSDNQTSPTVDVTVVNKTNQATTLSCWVDYNGDGNFDNATERGQASVPSATNAQVITVTLPDVPATAGYDTQGTTYMRCRVASANGADNAIGSAADGEVEDYQISIASHCSLNATMSNLQCDDQGTVDSTDDTWSFEHTISGVDVAPSTTWQASGDISSTGVYDVQQSHYVGLIVDKPRIDIVYSDTQDASCKVEADTLFAPPSCSGDCALFVTSGSSRIDNQNTSSSLDDELIIPLTVTGIRPANAAWQVYRQVAGTYPATAIHQDQGNKTIELRLLVSDIIANDPDGVMLRIQQTDYSDCLQEIFVSLPNLASLTVNKTVEGAPAPSDWQFTLSSENCPLPTDLVNPAAVSGAGGQTTFTGLARYHNDGQVCLYQLTENQQSGYFLNTALSDHLTAIHLLSADQVTVNITNTALAYVYINDAEIVEGDTGTRDLVFDVLLSSSATRSALRNNGNGNNHCNDGQGQDDIKNPHCNHGISTSSDFTVIAGTASEGVDYEAVAGGTITIAAGESATTISVPIVGDLLVEGNETFTIQLSNVVNGILIDGEALGTIIDDDEWVDLPTISLSHAASLEGDSGLTTLSVVVSLDKPAPAGGVSLDYITDDDSATLSNNDYQSHSGTLSIPEGATQGIITLNIVGDLLVENDETFRLNVSNPINANLNQSSATLTIINDDGVVSNCAQIIAINEALLMPEDSADCVTIPHEENTPNLSISQSSSLEGDNGTTALQFIVTLSEAAPSSGVSVDYASADQSATTSNNDYQAVSGTLTIPAGATQGVIEVLINGDTEVEADETFVLNLSNPQAANLTAANTVGTIINDDGVVSNCAQIIAVNESGLMPDNNNDCVTLPHEERTPDIFISQSSSLEGHNGTTALQFIVTLSEAAPSSGVSVDYASADQSATTSNNDYQAVSGTLTLPAGATQGVIEVLINGDTEVEADETFVLNLSNPQQSHLSSNQVIGTIINDDGLVLANCAQITGVDQTELMPSQNVRCVSQPLQSIHLCQDLKGYWPLNEPLGQSVATDASGNGQDLPLLNMDAYNDWGNGKLSGALSFDGVNDYVQRETVSADLQAAHVTVSAWIKVTEGSWQWIAAQGDNYGLYLNNHTDLVFYFYNGSAWPAVTANNLNFTDGQWHHVAGTYDGSQLMVYLDGVAVASKAESRAIVYNKGTEVSLGAMQGNRLFKGQLDDVRMYNRALNANEISALYQTPVECPNLAPINLKLRKTANKSTVYSGDEVIFTLSVTNVGSVTASNIVTSDLLPDGFVYLSDNSNGAYQAATGEWQISQIQAGETQHIEITTQVQ